MTARIETVEGRDALTELLLFHDEVYRERDARWTAIVPFQLPILSGGSPFCEGRVFRPYVAREDGRIVARVVALIDRRYQRHWNEALGHVVMYEALPGARQATRALMGAACEWLAEQGAVAARAGMGMLEFPFATDTFETLPPVFVRQNPAYYQAFLKDAGFESEQGFVDYRIDFSPPLIARWESALEATRRSGFELVPLKDVPESRRTTEFTTVWNEALRTHWGIAPSTEAEMEVMIGSLAPAGMLEHSVIAYRDGAPLGVVWVTPDMSAFSARAPERNLRDEEKVNFLGIGVRDAARGHGLALGMAAHAYLRFARQGYRCVSYTIVLDDNWPSRRTAEKLGTYVCANYLAYRRNLRR